jgi:uncharacterized protein
MPVEIIIRSYFCVKVREQNMKEKAITGKSRRSFLGISGAALVAQFLPRLAFAAAKGIPERGTLIGFGKSADNRCFIGSVDLDTRQVRSQSDLDFLGHGFAPNPVRPHLAVISEKHGKGCVEWDMRACKVTRSIDLPASREFYGHGIFTPDGKTLFLVESEVGDRSFKGVISIRDGDSYAMLGEFPSYGSAPHDVMLIDGGRTLIISNGGGRIDSDDLPCVSYVDVASRRLLRKLTLSTPAINTGHLAISTQGRLVVVSAPREGIAKDSPEFTGGISFQQADGSLLTAQDPVVARMRGETLSVAIYEPSMVIAATNPAGNIVTFWDFRTGRLLKVLDQFKSPRGISITRDGRYFALTFDAQTHALLIDAATLEPVAASAVETTFISGSHNFIYDFV